jgi:hypothetical protein
MVRHPEKLAKLREKANGRPGFTSGRRSNASRIEEDGPAIGTGEGLDSTDTSGAGRAGIGEERTEAIEGITGGFSNGIGPAISEISDDYSRPGEEGFEGPTGQTTTVILERDMDAEKERKRELARQRKVRQRDKQSATENTRDSDMRDNKFENVEIKVRNVASKPIAEEVKVFTKAEAEEKLEKLTYVFIQGSSLLDNVLEIVVKGHEKVEIWKLDEAEAQMLALSMLEGAKKDKVIAKQVRTIVGLYDKMYLVMLAGPRVYGTARHIKKQGGFSIR